jgi:hypothetical protein
MKFLKTKNISQFSINDRALIYYPAGNGPGNRIVVNANGGMMLPKGTTAQRPQLTSVRQPTDANGTIRYNTTIPALEAYVGGAWVTVASPFAAAITKQTLGPGDGTSTIFGPLNATFAPSYAASADNVLVLVENVMQISTTNFTITQNPSSTGTGSETLVTSLTVGNNGTQYIITSVGNTDYTLIGATSTNATALTASNNGTQYVITSAGSTDFTLIGAASSVVGTIFTKSGVTGVGTGTVIPRIFTSSGVAGVGTGKVREIGYYLSFASAVPASGGGGNPVYATVYYGYAN